MCRLGARVGPPCRAPGCRLRGTGLLLLAYLAYLVLGSCVFWALEGRAIQDSSHSFQQDQWHLLQNYTCLDSPALDLLIRTTVPLSRNLTCPSLCCPLGGGWPLGPQSLRQGGGQKDIIRAYKVGAHLLGNTTSMGRWEFMGSFFFSVSTITTIGPRPGPVAGGRRRAAVRPAAVPAAAAAAVLAHGGLELPGELLLRLRHAQHRGLRRLRDWDGPLPSVPAVVQERRVPVDPVRHGVAGAHHQADPVPAGDPGRGMPLFPPQPQRGPQLPKLEAGPREGAAAPLCTARLLPGGVWGSHTASGTFRSGCMLWHRQLRARDPSRRLFSASPFADMQLNDLNPTPWDAQRHAYPT
ncbi:potassium channel subfamily K member 17 isoform X2 [Dipodomys merriami]|uniref:potassium channel subfamily K member 17 isoform X2 n=1 Tax=Dipodomys merriami TaxID=94247 RepID=UPI003855A9EF